MYNETDLYRSQSVTNPRTLSAHAEINKSNFLSVLRAISKSLEKQEVATM